ncbi:MAG TPA: aminoacyl-histidine dipeptidase [Bacteroidales bacterium]|nr:aminoacyl-histidine dipeptidase [Bacteroidales bacterium]
MTAITSLKPKLIWEIFDSITKIPRPSKKEKKIRTFLINWAKKHQLEVLEDKAGNILMKKPATPGFENKKTIVLQSHMDMVCEKNNNIDFDFDNDSIQTYIENGWVTAKGTTLGADDGIGMAAQMAVLIDNTLEHGPIEALFTVDEETGLTGAFNLEPNFFTGKILLNLDSEDEGEIFIGCAGGIDTTAWFNYEKIKAPKSYQALKISITGLKGGHSGDDINKGHGNAIKILNRYLWEINQKYDIELFYFEGGNLRNAIPREASAIFLVSNYKKEQARADFNIFIHTMEIEYGYVEPNMKLTLTSTETPEWIIDSKTKDNLFNALYGCPNNVIAMSKRMPDMVESSTNLAAIRFKSDSQIEIITSQRSELESSKYDIAQSVESVFRLANATVKHSDGYPGWTPNPDSEILKIAKKSYKKLFNQYPIVRSIHAGLECGLFLKKYPYLDMISFGPTLRFVHSPDEKINIDSVQKFWDFLIEILKDVPEDK